MILGREKMSTLDIRGESVTLEKIGLLPKYRLLRLYVRTQKVIDLLADVQGYQIFHATVFQGDPHPGNILMLDDGSLGLIDYGQTKSISEKEKLGVARIVHAIGSAASTSEIASAMRNLGFRTRHDSDEILSKYAVLFFDSDIEGTKIGCPTPQSYFKALNDADPLVNVPDVAGK
jgi:aarF domain-containing kinase